MMKAEFLSRAECDALRGLAIIGIVLHNYAHWLSPVVKENEYIFSQHNIDWLERVCTHPDMLLPLHLISFVGHYGVPVFLFLSAYGLVKKYESSLIPPLWNDALTSGTERILVTPLFGRLSGIFLANHFMKLFRMMIVGFAAFVMIDAITPGRWRYTVVQIIAQLGLFNNFLPDPDHNIWPGPYWFFGLMMQMYIVYWLLRSVPPTSGKIIPQRWWTGARSFGLPALLMVVCCVAQMVCAPTGDTLNYLRYNGVGAMLPFCCGLLYARYEQIADIRIITFQQGRFFNWIWLVLALVAMVEWSKDFYLWFFVPVGVITASIALIKLLPRWCRQGLMWVGALAAALFVCHPIARKIIIPVSRGGDIYAGLLLYIVACVVMAWLYKKVMTARH